MISPTFFMSVRAVLFLFYPRKFHEDKHTSEDSEGKRKKLFQPLLEEKGGFCGKNGKLCGIVEENLAQL